MAFNSCGKNSRFWLSLVVYVKQHTTTTSDDECERQTLLHQRIIVGFLWSRSSLLWVSGRSLNAFSLLFFGDCMHSWDLNLLCGSIVSIKCSIEASELFLGKINWNFFCCIFFWVLNWWIGFIYEDEEKFNEILSYFGRVLIEFWGF